MSLLVGYDWPGNIRELKNVLEAAFVNVPGYRIGVGSLPLRITKHASGGTCPGERDQLLTALAATNWNKTKAAERLRWSRMTLYRKMASYNVVRTNGSIRSETS